MFRHPTCLLFSLFPLYSGKGRKRETHCFFSFTASVPKHKKAVVPYRAGLLEKLPSGMCYRAVGREFSVNQPFVGAI